MAKMGCGPRQLGGQALNCCKKISSLSLRSTGFKGCLFFKFDFLYVLHFCIFPLWIFPFPSKCNFTFKNILLFSPLFLALHTTPLSFQIISSLLGMSPASKTLSRDIQSLTQFLYFCLSRSLDILNVIFLSVSSSMMFPLSYWNLLFCKLLLCAFGKKLPSFFLCICLFFSFWKFDRASTPFLHSSSWSFTSFSSYISTILFFLLPSSFQNILSFWMLKSTRNFLGLFPL